MSNIIHMTEGEPPTASQPTDPGSVEGFERLVIEHHRELVTYARALSGDMHTAREIVQDAFITAFNKMDTFDVTRDFPTWMRGIVRNKLKEFRRKNRLRELPDSIVASIDADVAAWQEARLQGKGTVFEALETCISRLPDSLREAVDTFYFAHENGEEASETLGIAPAALRKRLQRARELLRGCIETKLSPN